LLESYEKGVNIDGQNAYFLVVAALVMPGGFRWSAGIVT